MNDKERRRAGDVVLPVDKPLERGAMGGVLCLDRAEGEVGDVPSLPPLLARIAVLRCGDGLLQR